MKKLFDETHPYGEHDRRRTQWYQLENDDPVQFLFAEPEEYGVSFLIPSDYSPLAGLLADAVKQSFLEEEGRGVTETHWVFYTNRRDGDAIGDQVRFTIMLREKAGRFDCDIHYSDFLFASAYDEIMALRQAILDRVSAG